MGYTQARTQFHALALVRIADAMVDEFVGDKSGNSRIAFCAHETEHHVYRCRPAGAGETTAVDLIQFLRHMEIREFLPKTVVIFPVDGAAVTIEKAGLGEHI